MSSRWLHLHNAQSHVLKIITGTTEKQRTLSYISDEEQQRLYVIVKGSTVNVQKSTWEQLCIVM